MSKGEQTRRRIVAKAAAVFNMRGFSGTSMGDLTQATGLEKGGIYNHFESKEALAVAAFDYAVAQIGARLEAAYQSAPRTADRLIAMARVIHDLAAQTPVPGGCPIINTAIEADDTNPAMQLHAQQAMTGLLKSIGRTVKEGVAAGELRPDTDPYTVASIVVATLEGALALTRLYADPLHMQRAMAHVTAYIRSLEL